MRIKSKIVMSWSSRKKKSGFFVTFIFSEGDFFNIWVLSQCIVYWISFQNIYTFTYPKKKKNYFIHFCYLFLKSSKVFSVSLKWNFCHSAFSSVKTKIKSYLAVKVVERSNLSFSVHFLINCLKRFKRCLNIHSAFYYKTL